MRLVRRDANHHAIVEALRAAGCTVCDLAAVGGGVPDLLVGRRNGRNYLLEIKDGSLPPSERKLNRTQQNWHSVWRGQVAVVLSVEDALRAVELLSPVEE